MLDADKRIIGKRLGVEQIEQFIRSYRPMTVSGLIARKMILDHSKTIEELRRQREAGDDEEHFEGDGHDH